MTSWYHVGPLLVERAGNRCGRPELESDLAVAVPGALSTSSDARTVGRHVPSRDSRELTATASTVSNSSRAACFGGPTRLPQDPSRIPTAKASASGREPPALRAPVAVEPLCRVPAAGASFAFPEAS